MLRKKVGPARNFNFLKVMKIILRFCVILVLLVCQQDIFIKSNPDLYFIYSQQDKKDASKSKRCLRLSGGSDHPSIPPSFSDVSECFYSCLGLSSKYATLESIKAAYRKKALRWHPDKNRNSPGYAEHRFKEIQRAYTVLTDPNDRAYYDANRERILAAGQRAAKQKDESAWFTREGLMKRRGAEHRQDRPHTPVSAFDVLMRRKKAACPKEPHFNVAGPSAFDYLMRRTTNRAATGGSAGTKYP